ncbi:MAG: TonB-dependent siderophore receptor, partial [Opitutaceae bacterium]
MHPRIRRLPPGRMFRHLIHLSCVLLSLACILPTYSADAEIRRVFNVPAGPAEQSLKLFSEQSGRGVIFSTDSLKDARTKAVQGEFTAREAVDRMVDGTVLVVTPDEKTGAFAIKRDSDPNAERAAPTVPGGRPGNGAKTEPRPVQRDAKDEAITLSPFTVNASSDTGYLATSTLSGSRLNTPLKDTAATINVLTAEFLADVGATDLTKALQWGNNVQPNLADTAALGAAGNDNNFFQERTTFRVRGIGATTMRNYFDWKMPVDNYNIDRIEESHGPNSILFGIGSAGGIINLSTKQANFQQSFRRASADVGSFGGYRGTLDVNQALLDGRLGVRVNAFYDHAGSFRTYGFEDKQAIHLAVIYRPTPHTRVRIEYEKGDQNEILASYGLFDGVSTWLAAGRPAFSTNIAANPALGIGRFGTAARVTYIENNHSLINMAARNFGPTGGTAVSRLILDPALADPNINGGGPGQLRHTYFDTYSAFIERRFGKSTYLELAYTRQDQNARLYRLDAGTADGGALSFDPNLTLA